MTIETLLSIPKSFYVSCKLTNLNEAIHLPVLVRYNVVCQNLKGKLIQKGEGKLIFGFGSVGIFDKKHERSILQIDGTIELNGQASFGNGSRLCVFETGILSIGRDFENTAAMSVVCKKSITIGNNVLTSWNTLVMDTDLHAIQNLATGECSCIDKPVKIGNNVWMGTRAIILKGTHIANGCIIGANAVVSGKIERENVLIAGNPGRIIKENVQIKR